MCCEAYAFIASRASRSAGMVMAHSADSVLSRARHYIGRLSSWHRVAKDVVLLGERFCSLLATCEIAVVEPPKSLNHMIRTLDGGLEKTIGRVLPNHRGHPLVTAALARLKSTIADLPTEMETFPHAEVVILEHFSVQNFAFANQDQYVACSKPSCYCCKLYFDVHPLVAKLGRYHGNLWMKWSIPRPLRYDDSTTDRVALKLTRRMSDLVGEDLVSTLLNGKSTIIQRFDSTTGFS